MKFTKKPDYYNRNNSTSNFNNLPKLQNNTLQFKPMSFIFKPVVSKPVVFKPVSKPVVSEPEVSEPVVSKPVVFEPVVFKPVVSEPVVSKPEVSKPVVSEPVVSEPEVSEPVVSEPEVSEPVVSKPVVSEPEVSKPVVFEPVVSKPVNTKVTNSNISEKQNKTITLEKFVTDNKISHVHISNSLKQFEKRFLEKYKLNLYDHTKDSNSNTIFFGLYDNSDLINVKNHKGKAFLMFGGTDLSEHFNRLPIYQRNLQFICISDDIQKRLVIFLKTKTRSTHLNSFAKKIWNVEMNMVNKRLFKPVNKIGTKIYVYDGFIEKPQNRKIYNTDIVEQVKKQFPQIEFIHSSNIKARYEKMPSIYADCFIGLRLTNNDGNANTVQELEAMNIPVVHNHSDYGLKWKTVADIVNHINENDYIKRIFTNCKKYDFYTLNNIDSNVLSNVEKNIEIFNQVISQYKKILFICTDYPGFGGAATNCYELQQYYEKKGHNCYGFYYNYDKTNKYNVTKSNYQVGNINNLSKLSFKPDLIIVKSFVTYNLQQRFKCPIFYLVGGIYLNSLDKYYYDIEKPEQNKYINKYVLEQINNSTYTFVNSGHTQELLKKNYNIDSYLFYSSFVPFLNKSVTNSSEREFENRKYDYGLIVSDFNRPIKNIQTSIDYLKNKEEKEKIVLIGKNSHKYKSHGFECIDLVEHNKMEQYYKDIKCIVQDSFYESCSNVKIEALMSGCKIEKKIVFISHELPNYGGSATNCYAMFKYYSKYFNSKCIFIDSLNYFSSLDKSEYNKKFYDINIIYHNEDVNKKLLEYINRTDIIILRSPQVPFTKNINFKLLKEISKIIISIFGGGLRNNFYKSINKINSEQFLSGDYSSIYNKNHNVIDIKELTENENYMNVIKISDYVSTNTNLYDKIFKTVFKNKYIGNYLFSSINKSTYDVCTYKNNSSNWVNRDIDILFVASSLSRNVKGYVFFLNLVKDLNYNIVVVGKKKTSTIIHENIKYIPFTNNINKYLIKSKLVINTSLFEASSNMLFEAIVSGCNILSSNIIGNSNIYKNCCIVNNYIDKNEWIDKIKYLLKQPINCLINNNNIKQSVDNFKNYLLQDNIYNKRIKILITSTQYPYFGGAATNAYKFINYLRLNNYSVAGVFFEDSKNNVDPDNLGGIFKASKKVSNTYISKFSNNIKQNIFDYLNGEPDIILCFNFCVPIITKTHFPDSKIVYMVVGNPSLTLGNKSMITNNISAMKFLKITNKSNLDNYDNKIYDLEKKSLECANFIWCDHSELPLQIVNHTFPDYFENKHNYFYHDYSSIFIKNDILNKNVKFKNKIYDLIIISSNWDRKVKNKIFAKKVLGLFPNLKKIVIGNNSDYFQDLPNTYTVDLIEYNKVIDYLTESKILLIPSLYESGPNVLIEAIYTNCQVLSSRNIGKKHMLHRYNLCKDVYDINEWKDKIEYLLNNKNLKLPICKVNETKTFYLLHNMINS